MLYTVFPGTGEWMNNKSLSLDFALKVVIDCGVVPHLIPLLSHPEIKLQVSNHAMNSIGYNILNNIFSLNSTCELLTIKNLCTHDSNL